MADTFCATRSNLQQRIVADQPDTSAGLSVAHDGAYIAKAPTTTNIFGSECIEHISPDQVISLLLRDKWERPRVLVARTILRTAAIIYADPTYPENITCILSEEDPPQILTRGARGWDVHASSICESEVLAQIMRKCFNLLFDRCPNDVARYRCSSIDIRGCGAALKSLAVLEWDPAMTEQIAGKKGQLKTVLIRAEPATGQH